MGETQRQLPRWGASEEDVLREFAGRESAEKIGKRVGRSKNSVLEKIKKMGLKGIPKGLPRSWTDEQMEALKSVREDISSRNFARRWSLGEESVRWWGRKLGIKFKRKDRWLADQDVELRSILTAEEAMQHFGRTRRSVLCKARSLGITLQSPRSGRPRGSVGVKRGDSPPRMKVVKKRVKAPEGSVVVWCKVCGSPVVDWRQHFERMPGCKVVK